MIRLSRCAKAVASAGTRAIAPAEDAKLGHGHLGGRRLDAVDDGLGGVAVDAVDEPGPRHPVGRYPSGTGSMSSW